MGVSVTAFWPGITEEQIESQPGFYSDCHPWGSFMAEREGEPEVLDAIRKLKADAILTFITDGLKHEDVRWVTPQELREAANRLRDAVRADQPEVKPILETYARNAINEDDSVAAEFIQDLDDIESIANWAEEEGATRMTLEVNW